MYTAAATRDTTQYLTQYAPLVKRIAYHMMSKLPASVEIDDIIQTGMLGLLDAINLYEVASRPTSVSALKCWMRISSRTSGGFSRILSVP